MLMGILSVSLSLSSSPLLLPLSVSKAEGRSGWRGILGITIGGKLEGCESCEMFCKGGGLGGDG